MVLQALRLLSATSVMLQTNGVEQAATAAMLLLVKVHAGDAPLKVAVKLWAVPLAGSCMPVKVCDVLLPKLPTATVADAPPLNTKLPVVGGLVNVTVTSVV